MATKTQQLVKYLAVGKHIKDSAGVFTPGKHVILCQNLTIPSDPATASYKTRIDDILTKAAARLTLGRRLRLTSDDPGTEYELHLLAEEVTDNPSVIIFYFVVTDTGFSSAHAPAKVIADIKTGLYETGPSAIVSAQKDGLQSRMGPTLKNVSIKYATNKIHAVASRVEEVKTVMRDNIDMSIKNIDKLSEMEDKSNELEKESAQFAKQSNRLDRSMKCKNIKLILIGIILVVVVLTAIIYPLAKN